MILKYTKKCKLYQLERRQHRSIDESINIVRTVLGSKTAHFIAGIYLLYWADLVLLRDLVKVLLTAGNSYNSNTLYLCSLNLHQFFSSVVVLILPPKQSERTVCFQIFETEFVLRWLKTVLHISFSLSQWSTIR